MEKYKQWLNYPFLDERLKVELKAMSEEEIHDAFYTNLEFGTAGMRGLLGVGCNRLNIYTIRKANVGLAKFITKRGKQACDRGVVIAYDNRYMSYEFAFESARVLASYNIKCYVFESLRPTPELSFAVRYLNCFAGIVITASHNPKEYNGYKLYDENGCQMTPVYIEEIIPYIEAINDELAISTELTESQGKLITTIGSAVDIAYINEVMKIQLNPLIDKNDLKIIFTPQHGTALQAVEAVLNEAGYQYITVNEQSMPDEAFSNTKTPNPEQAEAYELALQYAKDHDADLVLSTDPDADRIGVAVKHDNEYILMSGNQTGAVLLEYVLSQNLKNKTMPKNPIMFNTIVTGDLGEKVANKYHVTTEKTLTGFKYIGERIDFHEKALDHEFVFGYEESYGYLIKPIVRDKDAIQASLLIAEAAAYYKYFNKTLWDVLLDLYAELGWYKESQVSIVAQGAKGADLIKSIMLKLRNEPMRQIGDVGVIRYEDYQIQKAYELGKVYDLILPQADVIKYFLADGSWIAIRPSGTEPKCKIYYCIAGSNEEQLLAKEKYYHQLMAEIVNI